MIDVSVIIINYNTKELTKNCIDSIFEKTSNITFEVILVDNASTDGSLELFAKDNRIIFIKSEKNLGFGRANNLGYQYAKGKYLFLLNSDTLLLNNAIYEFYAYMESHSTGIGCVGCELVDEIGASSYSFGTFPNIKFFIGKILANYRIGLSCLYFPSCSSGKHPIDVDYSSGADMFIPRSVADLCGLFDQDFFMYFEEVEMQHRFHEKGFSSQVIDTPKIAHLFGGSGVKKGRKSSAKISMIELESRYIYCGKVFSLMKYLLISLLHMVLVPWIILNGCTLKEKKLMLKIILQGLCSRKKASMFFTR